MPKITINAEYVFVPEDLIAPAGSRLLVHNGVLLSVETGAYKPKAAPAEQSKPAKRKFMAGGAVERGKKIRHDIVESLKRDGETSQGELIEKLSTVEGLTAAAAYWHLRKLIKSRAVTREGKVLKLAINGTAG